MNSWRKKSVRSAIPLLLILLLSLAACSGGGDGGMGQETAPDWSGPIPESYQGLFIDSFVDGLQYVNGYTEGITENQGEFTFYENEPLRFFLGNIQLGQAPAQSILTPVDLVDGAVGPDNEKVLNICRFLQTLDNDANPDNGIQIPPALRQEALSHDLNFNQTADSFSSDPAVIAAVNALTALTEAGVRPLVPADAAREHMSGTIDALCTGFFYYVMEDYYYWYDRMPAMDPADYTTPEVMLGDAVYGEKDLWSVVLDRTEFHTYEDEGRYIGIGYSAVYDDTPRLYVRYVIPGSPAAGTGLGRGDEILAINGLTIQEIDDQGLWATVDGPNEVGEPVTLDFRDVSGQLRSVEVQKEWVDIKSTVYRSIILQGDRAVGYLVFTSFDAYATDEILEDFAFFKQQGVNDLILDLRYNPGGRLSNALILASHIAGVNAAGLPFCTFRYNDKHSDEDFTYYFYIPQDTLNLQRVVVLTGWKTCSASEALINGLTPFIQVTTVGETTCGKPVGMRVYDYYNRSLLLVEVMGENALHHTEYFDGFPPDCPAADSLNTRFGDSADPGLAAALSILQNGSCQGPVGEALRAQTQPPAQRTPPLPGIRGYRNIF